MRSLSPKLKKICPIEFFAKILQIAKIYEIYKGNLWGQVLKRPAFSPRCTDFAQIVFKSHFITKYESSRSFGIPFQFEKLSNRVPKKVRVLRTPPGVDRIKKSLFTSSTKVESEMKFPDLRRK